MAVEEKVNTPEQNAEEGATRKGLEAKTKTAILDSLDLSAEGEKYERAVDVEEEKPAAKEGEEGQEEGEGTAEEEGAEGEGTGEEGQEGEGEGSGEGEGEEGKEEDLAPEGEGDEVVSKKKVQKRLDKLTRDNATLKARLDAAEAKKASEAEEADPDMKKLNVMSHEGLKATKKSIIVEIAKATAKGDDKRVSDLVDLQEKVDTAIQTAPQRFVGRQVEAYNRVADEIENLAEIPMTKESAGELKAIASEVYRSNPELHTLVGGQALALKHAYALYKATLSNTAEKGKTDDLKRKVNTLKQKTGLESGGLKKSVGKNVEVTKLRKVASRGNTNDKLNLIKEDPAFGLDSLIPEEYKEE